jgi:hypothetical protein
MFLYNMFFSNITLFKRSSNKCYKAYTRSQIVNTLHLACVNVSENSRSQIVNFAGHTSQIVNTTDWCACYTPCFSFVPGNTFQLDCWSVSEPSKKGRSCRVTKGPRAYLCRLIKSVPICKSQLTEFSETIKKGRNRCAHPELIKINYLIFSHIKKGRSCPLTKRLKMLRKLEHFPVLPTIGTPSHFFKVIASGALLSCCCLLNAPRLYTAA